MDIGEKLARARTSSGLTQEQAAEALNISRQTLSNWENCKTNPDILYCIDLSKLYGITLDSLLKEDDAPSEYALQIAEETDKKLRRKRALLIIAAAAFGIFMMHVYIIRSIKNYALMDLLIYIALYMALPVLIGLLIGAECKPKTSSKWAAAVSGVLILITLAGFLERSFHLLGWIKVLAGPEITALYIGLLLGKLLRWYIR